MNYDPVSLDPRTKLVVASCLSSAALLVSSLPMMLGLLVFSAALLLLFRVRISYLLKKTKPLLVVILGVAFLQSVFTPGESALLTIGAIQIFTLEGIGLALQLFARILMIIAASAILGTSSSRSILQGLIQWKMPYELAFMAMLAIRFLPLFAEEFKDAFCAIRLRGIDFRELPIREKVELCAGLFQPVAGGALCAAKGLSLSVEMRGFRACEQRTSYHVLQLHRIDYLVMVISVILTAAFLTLYYLVSF